jgi:hypothetical protein
LVLAGHGLERPAANTNPDPTPIDRRDERMPHHVEQATDLTVDGDIA